MAGSGYKNASIWGGSLERSSLKITGKAITGHWSLGKQAFWMDIASHQTCQCCETPTAEVDLFHFWCACSAQVKVFRVAHYFQSLEDVRNIDMQS